MYPYIQASSDDHSDTVKAFPHSNFCAIAAVLQGRNEKNPISIVVGVYIYLMLEKV